MATIGGKKITVEKSLRRGCTDLVFCEEKGNKKFVAFVSQATAKKIMIVCEDLLMKLHQKTNFWAYEEAGRSISLEIISGRQSRSLAIKTTTKDVKQWRRRVFIPGGSFGEGWLSFARKITVHLKQARESSDPPFLPLPVMKLPSSHTTEPAAAITDWKRLRLNRHILGGWEFMGTCTVDRELVDWQQVGHTLANVLEAEEDFQFFPFSKNKALLAITSVKERDFVCSLNNELSDEGISLSPWTPEANAISPIASTCGWVGIIGLPFNLWTPVLNSPKLDVVKLVTSWR